MHKKILIFLAAGVSLAAAQNAAPGVYLAVDNRVVMEIELAELTNPGNWEEESVFTGFSGTGYYIARNGVDGQNVENALSYTFRLEESGDYWVALHNYIEDVQITESNDIHLRLDDGVWMKTWSHGFGAGHTWNWETGFSPGGEDLVRPVWENVSAGEHTVYLGSRSTKFGLDRIHIQKVDLSVIGGHWSEWYSGWDSDALFDKTLPVSPKEGETGLFRSAAGSEMPVMRLMLHGGQLTLDFDGTGRRHYDLSGKYVLPVMDQ